MDGIEYDVIERAVELVKDVYGLSCEIGVREGGASQLIMNLDRNRIHIGIDPYGELIYRETEETESRMDYSLSMQARMTSNLFTTNPEQFIFFPMEDTEFFNRFSDGVPIYRNGKKVILNNYALVFIDGPHSLADVQREFNFFKDKITVGGIIIFDNIWSYPHGFLEREILSSGFELLEHVKTKKSYKKVNRKIEYMPDCLYPLPSKKPCGKPATASHEKYGSVCARHARELAAATGPQTPVKIRKVMIGTLSYDGRVDVRYVDALINTLKQFKDVNFVPIFMSYDSLIQRARNDTVHLALKHGFDDLIFIDSDIEWNPEWIYKLLNYPVDVVGGTYRRKTDSIESYVVRSVTNPAQIDTRTGLMKVDGLGCGFIRLSRKALQYLWDASEPYIERDRPGEERRMIFEVLPEDGELISEDLYMCFKLKRGGFDIHLDPRMCCNHTGIKQYQGNFVDYYQRVLDDLKAADENKV